MLLSNTFAKVPWRIVIALAWVVCGPLPQLLLGVGAPIGQLPESVGRSVSAERRTESGSGIGPLQKLGQSHPEGGREHSKTTDIVPVRC